MKARLVAKDLASRRKVPAIESYAVVPPAHGVRLILAQADGANIISTTDYKVAYLQSPNKEEIHWVWIKY